MFLAPEVHEHVAGAGIETAHLADRWQQGDVGDAADVGHHPFFGCISEGHLVEGRQERRTLAA